MAALGQMGDLSDPTAKLLEYGVVRIHANHRLKSMS